MNYIGEVICEIQVEPLMYPPEWRNPENEPCPAVHEPSSKSTDTDPAKE